MGVSTTRLLNRKLPTVASREHRREDYVFSPTFHVVLSAELSVAGKCP